MNTIAEWVDPDEATELGPEWFAKAVLKVNGEAVGNHASPESDKEQVTLGIDRDVLDRFRAESADWRTRINEVLRSAMAG